jgi:hypothetical protein
MSEEKHHSVEEAEAEAAVKAAAAENKAAAEKPRRRLKKIDFKKPHTTIYSVKPRREAFIQGGLYFDGAGIECGEAPKPAPKKKAVFTKREQSRDEAVARAASVLGDINVDPQHQLNRENAAAAEAENLADDA